MKLVDEVTKGAFADDDSELEFFFSESDSDSSEGVSSEDSSAEEIGTYNIHIYNIRYFNNTSNTRKKFVTF